MQKISEPFEYFEFNTDHELPESDRNLLNAAREAMKAAYTPYSQYNVGAAILLGNGSIVTGSNQENRAFPSGLCAERVAVFSAGAGFPGIPMKAIAITAQSDNFPVTDPVAPCGACRQSMLEYELKQGENIRILVAGESGKVIAVSRVRDLLPLAFMEDRLGRNK
jgi:cytidine deaminase